MEDAHAAVLDIDGGGSDSTAFFAVYDGHGGENISSMLFILPSRLLTFSLGSTVAKYAGQNVHKRLVLEETYKEKDYEVAMKKAFMGIDEDLQASMRSPFSRIIFFNDDLHKIPHIQKIPLVAQQSLLWSLRTKFTWYVFCLSSGI
jgi:serine/threonine protein phosphatase PrpC